MGSLLSTNRFQHLKKKYFDDIIKKLGAKRHFWFYCLQENDISRGNCVNNVFGTC